MPSKKKQPAPIDAEMPPVASATNDGTVDATATNEVLDTSTNQGALNNMSNNMNTNGGDDNGNDGNVAGFVVNFEDIPERQEVPNGRYAAVITHAKPGTSQAGLPKMDVRWKIEDGGDYDGQVIFDTISFSPKALWRVKAFLLALGFSKNFNEAVTPDLLIGERAVITTAIDESTNINPETGEPYPPRARVKAYARVGTDASVDNILARR